MDSRVYTDEVKVLCMALSKIDDPEEIFKLLSDVCTIREILDLAQRFLVAKLLDEGETYNVISEKTGASATTIARVSKELKYGLGGYEIALNAIKELDEKKDQSSSR